MIPIHDVILALRFPTVACGMFMTDRRIYSPERTTDGSRRHQIVSKPSGNVQAKSMCSSTVYYPECTLCSLRLICEQFTTAHFYLVADDPHKSGMLKISVLVKPVTALLLSINPSLHHNFPVTFCEYCLSNNDPTDTIHPSTLSSILPHHFKT